MCDVTATVTWAEMPLALQTSVVLAVPMLTVDASVCTENPSAELTSVWL